MNKLLIALTCIMNVIFRRRHYTLSFYSKPFFGTKRWFYDWNRNHATTWEFAEDNLEMVCGAEMLCEKYSNGKDTTTVDIICRRRKLKNVPEGYEEYVRRPLKKNLICRTILGADYDCNSHNFWICPVTLLVLGRYPKYIYMKTSL